RHLVRLVDDLLDISRITQGKIRMQMQPVDCVQVAVNAIESSRFQIDAHRHRLEVVLPASPLWVNGDPNRLEQVLNNLLNNAAKYSDEEGRVALSVASNNGLAEIRL